MNVKKIYKLNAKEVRYILRTNNKKFISGSIFNINIINQFPNKKYNKFGISISSKFHKKAVYRNIFRRYFFHKLSENNAMFYQKNGYKKIFVSFKKYFIYKNNDQEIKKRIDNDIKKIFSL